MKRIVLLSLTTSLMLSSLQGCTKQESVALGTLLRDRVILSATQNEVITALPVVEGSVVSPGQLLVQFDTTAQNAQVALANANLLKAQAYLEKLRNGARVEEVAKAQAQLAAHQAALTEAKLNLARAQEVVQKQLAAKAQLDHAQAAYDSATANVEQAKQALKVLTNGTRAEDLQIAEAELQGAKAKLESEQKRLADLSVRATRNGVLDSLPWNLGERVNAGSPVAVVLAGEVPFARVYVPASYRAKLSLGQAVQLHIDGVEMPIEGTIRWLSNDAAFTPYYALNQFDRSRLMYLVEVSLPNSQAALPNGLAVEMALTGLAHD
jgi:HlyD family secretion protein